MLRGKITGRTDETITYIAPEDEVAPLFGEYSRKYPLTVYDSAYILEGATNGKVLAKLTLPYSLQASSFLVCADLELQVEADPNDPRNESASMHSDPPGIATDYPAMMEAEVGKGKIIWACAPFESTSLTQPRKVFTSFVKKYVPEMSFASDDISPFADTLQLSQLYLNIEHFVKVKSVNVQNKLAVLNEATGQNEIIVIIGACGEFKPEEVQALKETVASAGTVLCQLETNPEATYKVLDMAKQAGVTTVFNPAPARKLPDEVLNGIDYITPNETEAEIITGIAVTGYESASKAADVLLGKGVKNVVITLGTAKNGADLEFLNIQVQVSAPFQIFTCSVLP